MAGFIFGGNTGTSYDELQRKRAIAEQLMEGRSGPMRPVDGIASAAESITGALLGKKLDKQKSKLDDDWMASAAAQGLDPQRLAILKELSPQQRNAYMLQRMDAKPTGGGGGPSKSELQAQQANEVLAALFGKKPEANSEYSTGSSPDPSVNKGFTSGENLSFGQPAPQIAGYTPPPVTGPIPESQWGVTDVAQAAIDRAAPPEAPMQAPAAPQPTQGLSFGTPLAVSQDTGQGVTMDQVNELRMTGIMSQNPALLKAADALEKMIPAEPETPEPTSDMLEYEWMKDAALAQNPQAQAGVDYPTPQQFLANADLARGGNVPGSYSQPQTPGQKKLDEAYGGGDYIEWTQGGGADMASQISNIGKVADRLESGEENLTGSVIGALPDSVNAAIRPNVVSAREDVESVVQRNLRVLLGAQFTEKEGERLIARAYNPRLPEQENAKRLRRLEAAMTAASEARNSQAEYFSKNGTLTGWTGKVWTAADFENAIDGKKTEVSDDDFLKELGLQ